MNTFKYGDKVFIVNGLNKGKKAKVIDGHTGRTYIFLQVLDTNRKRYYDKSYVELITKEKYPEFFI